MKLNPTFITHFIFALTGVGASSIMLGIFNFKENRDLTDPSTYIQSASKLVDGLGLLLLLCFAWFALSYMLLYTRYFLKGHMLSYVPDREEQIEDYRDELYRQMRLDTLGFCIIYTIVYLVGILSLLVTSKALLY